MKIELLGDRLLAKSIELEEETTASGLYIPDTAKEKSLEAIVMAVGPGRYEHGVYIEPEVKIGDEILYSEYAGTKVTVEAQELLLLRFTDVIGITKKVEGER
jgi:chaperonin GroES